MNTILAIIPAAATTSREYIVLLLKVYFITAYSLIHQLIANYKYKYTYKSNIFIYSL